MKNKLIYFIAALLLTVTACNDDKNEEPTLTGLWSYVAPHFVFGYSEEKVEINIGGEIKQFTPEFITTLFKAMANEKMGDYFTGIQFVSKSEMNIRMKFKDDTQKTLKAIYEIQGSKLGITLDKESLKEITGQELNIPQLSFDYIIKNNQLIAYLNWTYIKSMLNTSSIAGMLDQVFPMIAETMLKESWQSMPEQAKQAVINQLKATFETLKSKTTELEIGVVMEPCFFLK